MKKIESLQSLRAIAFLGIFLVHAQSKFSWSALGVSTFFVMSGYFLTQKNWDKEIPVPLKSRITFSLKHIKKIYKLYFVTTIMAAIVPMAAMLVRGVTKTAFLSLLGKLLLCLPLMQSWYPNAYVCVSLNGAAWFLSSMVFLYFLFPVILKTMKKHDVLKEQLLALITILALQVVLSTLVLALSGENEAVYKWFTYCFPPFRLGDFVCGCILGRMCCGVEEVAKIEASETFVEIIAIVITIFVCKWIGFQHNNIVIEALCNMTTLYIPISILWVYLFARKGGLLTAILDNRVCRYIGNLSSYAFLIHYIITYYVNTLEEFTGMVFYGWQKALVIIAEFLLSILMSEIYKRFDLRYNAIRRSV